MVSAACRSACLVASLAVLAPAAGAQAFRAARITTTGTPLPEAIALGDLDEDGHLDTAVALQVPVLNGAVDVALGDGRGGFLPPVEASVSGKLTDVALADLDGDGHLDVLAAGSTSYRVFWLPGDGSGTLGAPVATQLPAFAAEPTEIEIADFDGDGALDVLAAGGMGLTVPSGQLRLLRGDGTGALAAPADFPTGGSEPRDLQIGDVNGDGNIDAVVFHASVSDSVALLAGDGHGAFAAPHLLPVIDSMSDGALGDADGDGDLDIAVDHGFALAPPLDLLLGDGAGGFSPTGAHPVPAGAGSFSPVFADMDGDGRNDLVVRTKIGASVLRNAGGTTFLAAPSWALGAPEGRPVLGDVNHDGRNDLLAVLDHSGFVCALNDGAGGLFAAAAEPLTANGADVALSDFDGDGHLDAAVALESSPPGTVLLHGDGHGELQPVPGAPNLQATFLQAADLDGDGDADLVGLYAVFDGEVKVAPNLDHGSFGPVQTEFLHQIPTGFALADLDGDGLTDMVVPQEGESAMALLSAQPDGQLGAPQYVPLGVKVREATPADFDRDGNLDVAVIDFIQHVVRVLHGDGDGGLQLAASFAAGTNPGRLRAAHVDDDGLIDLVGMDQGPSGAPAHSLLALLGDGDGGFLPPRSSPLPTFVGNIRVADVDGDGRVDVLSAVQTPDSFVVSRGDGAGTFAPTAMWATNYDLAGLALGDLDEDGRPDVVLATEFGRALTLALDVSAPFTWTPLGGELAGAKGPPLLTGTGSLQPDSKARLVLGNALPGSVALLVVGASIAALPLHGGVLVPAPDLVVDSLPTGPDGRVDLELRVPAGLPSGSAAFVQMWVVDAGGRAGFAASRALKASFP